MTDRELLELAAKAAGIELRWRCIEGAQTAGAHPGPLEPIALLNGRPQKWSPLIYDGDALRLAVRLVLNISFDRETGAPAVYSSIDGLPAVPYQNDEARSYQDDSEVLAKLRRAIVRAAAEIGKTLAEGRDG